MARFRDIRAHLDDEDFLGELPSDLLGKTTLPEPEKELLSPASNRRSRRAAGNVSRRGQGKAWRDKVTWHPHRIAYLRHLTDRAVATQAAV